MSWDRLLLGRLVLLGNPNDFACTFELPVVGWVSLISERCRVLFDKLYLVPAELQTQTTLRADGTNQAASKAYHHGVHRAMIERVQEHVVVVVSDVISISFLKIHQ